MKKKILFRSFFGAPIGVTISLIITVIFLFVRDTENITLHRPRLLTGAAEMKQLQ